MPEPWEEPVGKTEPIKIPTNAELVEQANKLFMRGVGEEFNKMSSNHPSKRTEWIRATLTTDNPDLIVRATPFLDTLVFRDDLNKSQIKMAKRAIESLEGMIRVGWLREG